MINKYLKTVELNHIWVRNIGTRMKVLVKFNLIGHILRTLNQVDWATFIFKQAYFDTHVLKRRFIWVKLLGNQSRFLNKALIMIFCQVKLFVINHNCNTRGLNVINWFLITFLSRLFRLKVTQALIWTKMLVVYS